MNDKIQEAIKKLVWKDEHGREYISLENSRLDFSQNYLFFGFTKSGNVKLGDIHSWEANGINPKWNNRIGKIKHRQDNIYSLWTDGFSYSVRFEVRQNTGGD